MQVSSRRAPLVIIRNSETSRGSLQEWCRATAAGPPAYPQDPARNTGSTPGSVDAAAFGAKGDGTADDTASIQRTLDSAAAKGGIVALTPDKYLVTGSLRIPPESGWKERCRLRNGPNR